MLQNHIDVKSSVPAARPASDRIIDEALRAVRDHLDMPIAYLSEFVDGRSVFRHVNAPGLEHMIAPGDSRSLDEVYCHHIVDGRLPNLIPDTSAFELARSLPVTRETPIGSHVSLPIHRGDGSVYGMFCCLSPVPNPSLNDRDLKVMSMFANLAAEQVREQLERDGDRSAALRRTTGMLAEAAYDMLFQPIYRLGDGHLASFEALCRFRSESYRSPDIWFADARRAGLQVELEMAVIRAAVRALPDLPAGVRLAVNASPDTVAEGDLLPIFRAAGADRMTLEITEHEQTTRIDHLSRAVAALRDEGVRIAIDDVGAGYAGLHQILQLKPNVLKLDMSLVRDVHSDPARRALASALVRFAGETGAHVVAEGIEHAQEWHALRRLGVDYGQGWLMGRPGAIEDAAPFVRI
ncbi:EAL domain-containing protein [uncultured Jannaschia sp.]|uniref:sensor domain-containing phosphodiesterase n=1 Tax=uncultured Jannaschia sp. TaxID=293347 RepID=UPI0026321519|nr:EAL domain-containing protein [uncultured Jannaschia sp.]